VALRSPLLSVVKANIVKKTKACKQASICQINFDKLTMSAYSDYTPSYGAACLARGGVWLGAGSSPVHLSFQSLGGYQRRPGSMA
jgi:hypothetical protein